jgi:acyl carrier protein
MIFEGMSSNTFERVRGLVAKYLNIPADTIGEDSRLTDLGLDSLGALELVFEIEEEFKVSVPDERIRDFTTVRAVCEGIETLQRAAG